MRGIIAGRRILNRVQSSNRVKLNHTRPYFWSSTHNKATTINNSSRSNNGWWYSNFSRSFSNSGEQYKDLGNLNFMAATKGFFSDPLKKKFGLDSSRIVQLVVLVVGLPLAYYAGSYAADEVNKRNEKRITEFEARVKEITEMKLKAVVEDKAASSSKLLEVIERLAKLELAEMEQKELAELKEMVQMELKAIETKASSADLSEVKDILDKLQNKERDVDVADIIMFGCFLLSFFIFMFPK